MQFKLLAVDGSTVWVSPSIDIYTLGITPSIIVHMDEHYLLSGGYGNILLYRHMVPLETCDHFTLSDRLVSHDELG